MPQPPAQQEPKRSATLGVVAFVLVATQIVDLARGVLAPVTFVQTGWGSPPQPLNVGRLALESWMFAFLGILPCALAVVFGIVALVKNQGRAFGIAAVVLGALVLVIQVPMSFATLVFMVTR